MTLMYRDLGKLTAQQTEGLIKESTWLMNPQDARDLSFHINP